VKSIVQLKDFDTNQRATTKLFRMENWSEITFNLDEEWMIEGVLPKRGVGLLFGQSMTFKSFVAMDMALCAVLQRPWAGLRTESASAVYLGAEGADGLRKRIAGYAATRRDIPTNVAFELISAAPNLGAAQGDFQTLIDTIEARSVRPGLIVIDTIAKTMPGADENGQGMSQFLANAQALSQHFDCFVLAVHHVGHGVDAQGRPRGWSGITGALEVQILCERNKGEMSSTVTLQKSKDDESGLQFVASMSRVVLGTSKTGREVSTLVVGDVVPSTVEAKATAKPKTIAKSQKLLMQCVISAILDRGRVLRPFADGPEVRAVDEQHIRDPYFERIAEQADDEVGKAKLYDRQLKSFNRAIEAALKAQLIAAAELDGKRVIWSL
jgi:hypothetical protein